MIGRNQLIHAVIWLPALNPPRAILGPSRELVGPVHPANQGIYMVLIACADLQNIRNPVGVGLLPSLRRLLGVHILPLLDAGVVCDVNEVPHSVFQPVDYAMLATSSTPDSTARRRQMHILTKLLYRFIPVQRFDGLIS